MSFDQSNQIKDIIRTIPNYPKKGIQFRDITSLLEHPWAFRNCLSKLETEAVLFDTDIVVGIESRGFIFGAPVADALLKPFIIARKAGKLPNETVSKKFKLEYGNEELHIQKLSPLKGNIVIIDDLIATGGTALTCADLIHENWDIPKENITVMAIINLPDLKGSAIIKDNGYKVYTYLDFDDE